VKDSAPLELETEKWKLNSIRPANRLFCDKVAGDGNTI